MNMMVMGSVGEMQGAFYVWKVFAVYSTLNCYTHYCMVPFLSSSL